MATNAEDEKHLGYLRQALEEARKCTPVPTAFCVGCVIVAHPSASLKGIDEDELIIGRGYSRELPGNTHAEANALAKARQLATSPSTSETYTTAIVEELLSTASVYTTLEPCSVRTSGLAPCAKALLDAKVKRCYIGVAEPPDFVNCEGANMLKEGGVEVHWIKGLEDECLKTARGEW
ncbi:related to CAX4-required for full levels of dolichol-linked oligosaccharides [Serendipita indica DSM 11827]|uniref:Related to CAX4-required for full levels of dolichol-linked oligosaccharides n=1 Tax=Serendipita indica (strain DSM 11827) TaxID=1109443 RepID=G4U165_SERID|nr:related to CAX4-required for full levels of dolichol-linked oligosaccharides [Serendipita indica DSM 11827]